MSELNVDKQHTQYILVHRESLHDYGSLFAYFKNSNLHVLSVLESLILVQRSCTERVGIQ